MPRLGRHRRSTERHASVLTELAICLPVLTLLVLGSIDISNSIHLKHTATLVAYETGQVATAQGGTETAGSAKGQAILTERGINNATISYSPRITDNTIAGTSITITVSLPANGNTLGLTGLFTNRTISVSVVMRKM